MKFLSGIEELQIKATKTDGSLRVDDQLPWVTNLCASGFDVAAAIRGDELQTETFVAQRANAHSNPIRPHLDAPLLESSFRIWEWSLMQIKLACHQNVMLHLRALFENFM